MAAMQEAMKTCTKCGLSLDYGHFGKCAKVKSGMAAECKACSRERAIAYRAEHGREISAKTAARRLANLDRVREEERARYASSPDRKKAATKKWRAKNQEKVRSIHAAWIAKLPPSKIKQYRDDHAERRKEYKRNAVATLSDQYIAQLLALPIGASTKDVPPELLEVKRLHLKLKRAIKERMK